MNSKTTTYALVVLLAGSLVFAFYTYSRSKKLETENTEWHAKYEEALIDAEESSQRIEKMKEELEQALKDSEMHRKQAEDALNELKKRKR